MRIRISAKKPAGLDPANGRSGIVKHGRLWAALTVVVLGSFAVLGYFGYQIYQKAPPVPARVVTADGRVLWTAEQIRDGQSVWQSMGGQEVGSIWGHGAYVAPDWSADRVHREAVVLLDRWAKTGHGKVFDELDAPTQAALRARLQAEVRGNGHDPSTGDLVVSADRAAAIEAVNAHYDALFGDGAELKHLRDAYAIPANSVPDAQRRYAMNGFFFWAAWSCTAERPGEGIS
jgi:nitric oxide reductase subunit B